MTPVPVICWLVVSSTVSNCLVVCSTVVICRWSSVRLFLIIARVVDRGAFGYNLDNFLKCFIVCSTVVVYC